MIFLSFGDKRDDWGRASGCAVGLKLLLLQPQRFELLLVNLLMLKLLKLRLLLLKRRLIRLKLLLLRLLLLHQLLLRLLKFKLLYSQLQLARIGLLRLRGRKRSENRQQRHVSRYSHPGF
jgi:hypothetical protein